MRHLPTAAAALCAAVVVFAVFAALGVGKRTAARTVAARGGDAAAVKTAAVFPPPAPLATYSLHAPHVLSTNQVYSVQGVVGGPNATPPPELPPTKVSAFNRPIALYRAYAARQLVAMQGQLSRLTAALSADDRTGAEEAWRAAYSSYLRLGAVYLSGAAASLNQQIDGSAGGLQGGVANPRFEGLHRIEYGLWTGASPDGLLVWGTRLEHAVGELRDVLPHVTITPLEYATRAHEILEDAVRDLLSGTAVQWSGEGVLGTVAGVQATEEVISTLRPVLGGVEHVIPAVDSELAALRGALSSIAAAHGGHLPSNGQLTRQQAERLDGTLGGALEALSQVPGVLETEAPTQIPQIPKASVRIDP